MSAVGAPRGLLRHAPAEGRFHHARIAPPSALADCVQHVWIVRWDLGGGAAQVRETLPHPNVHLTVEDGQARVTGVHRGRFTRTLTGRGGVVGIKFVAGAFRAWLGGPVSALRDRTVPAAEVLRWDVAAYAGAVCAGGDDDARIVEAACTALLAVRPQADPQAAEVAALVARVEHDRGVLRVEQLARIAGTTPRTLQRLFQAYVGASPKWVINRYRMHEAVERLARGGPADWADFALQLGYFDQAHFIRDFRALVGRPPAEYAAVRADDAAPGAQR